MKSEKIRFTSIDDYMAVMPDPTRELVEQLRAMIKALVPDAKEKISYQIPAFELNGRNLIHFAGWKNHISIYPIPAGAKAFNAEVSKYADGKGTLKFPLDKPLPSKLIKEIVKYRVSDNLKNIGKKKY